MGLFFKDKKKKKKENQGPEPPSEYILFALRPPMAFAMMSPCRKPDSKALNAELDKLEDVNFGEDGEYEPVGILFKRKTHSPKKKKGKK